MAGIRRGHPCPRRRRSRRGGRDRGRRPRPDAHRGRRRGTTDPARGDVARQPGHAGARRARPARPGSVAGPSGCSRPRCGSSGTSRRSPSGRPGTSTPGSSSGCGSPASPARRGLPGQDLPDERALDRLGLPAAKTPPGHRLRRAARRAAADVASAIGVTRRDAGRGRPGRRPRELPRRRAHGRRRRDRRRVARPAASAPTGPSRSRSQGTFCTPAPLPGLHVVGGAMAATGRSLDWLAESITGTPITRLIAEAAAVEPGAGGLVFLPYLAGERSPIWDPAARGAFIGLTAGQSRPILPAPSSRRRRCRSATSLRRWSMPASGSPRCGSAAAPPAAGSGTRSRPTSRASRWPSPTCSRPPCSARRSLGPSGSAPTPMFVPASRP